MKGNILADLARSTASGATSRWQPPQARHTCAAPVNRVGPRRRSNLKWPAGNSSCRMRSRTAKTLQQSALTSSGGEANHSVRTHSRWLFCALPNLNEPRKANWNLERKRQEPRPRLSSSFQKSHFEGRKRKAVFGWRDNRRSSSAISGSVRA